MKRHFKNLFENQWSQGKYICVDLNTDLPLPIVKLTADIAGAYKLNFACFDTHDGKKSVDLTGIIPEIHRVAPDVPIILGLGLEGGTTGGCAKIAFDYLGADGVILHPLFGKEAMKPFLCRQEKLCLFVCKTHDSGADEFQDLSIPIPDKEAKVLDTGGFLVAPLYQHIAYRIAHFWNENGNCGLSIGVSGRDNLDKVRKIVGEAPLYLQGLENQEDKISAVIKKAKNSHNHGMIINFSCGHRAIGPTTRDKIIHFQNKVRAAL